MVMRKIFASVVALSTALTPAFGEAIAERFDSLENCPGTSFNGISIDGERAEMAGCILDRDSGNWVHEKFTIDQDQAEVLRSGGLASFGHEFSPLRMADRAAFGYAYRAFQIEHFKKIGTLPKEYEYETYQPGVPRLVECRRINLNAIYCPRK